MYHLLCDWRPKKIKYNGVFPIVESLTFEFDKSLEFDEIRLNLKILTCVLLVLW